MPAAHPICHSTLPAEGAAPPPSAPDELPPVDPRIAAAAAGDRSAAQALLLRLLPRVRNLVRYLVRGDDAVDDIAQLVLLELLRSFGSYRGTGSLEAWSDRITVRVTLRRRKAAAERRKQQESVAYELHAVPSAPLRPDEYASRRRVVRWLDTLPGDQREALVLHHVVGLSIPELAAELDVPAETARSRLRLGMAKLRARSREADGEE